MTEEWSVLHLATGLTMLFEFYVGWEVLKWMEREETKKWTKQREQLTDMQDRIYHSQRGEK